METDIHHQIALELSKKQALEDSKKNGNGHTHDEIKIHKIELEYDVIGDHLQKGFKYFFYKTTDRFTYLISKEHSISRTNI